MRRNRRSKRKGSSLRLLMPMAVLGLTLLGAVLLSPAEKAGDYSLLDKKKIRKNALTEERHFTWFRLDSVLNLIRKIDPVSTKCRFKVEDGKAWFTIGPGIEEMDFQRIFLNLRPVASWKRLENCPVTFFDSPTLGFNAPLRSLHGIDYIPLPFDIMAGMLYEFGQRFGK